MSTRTVVLKGTWERPNTERADVGYMRMTLKGFRAQERGISGGFTVSRKNSEGRTLRGTFNVTVQVPFNNRYGIEHVGRPPELSHRAKHTLAWFLQDNVCRAPKLTVTSAAVRREG